MNIFTLKKGVCGLIFAFSLPVAAQTSTFTDTRDGKTYRTVRIDGKTWMAENLNYETEGSKCSDPDCMYGRLYDWNTAARVCPSNWRLPNNTDWDNLIQETGGNKVAGRVLKAQTGWHINKKGEGNGTDDYNWAALPGGRLGRTRFSAFDDVGKYGNWWSATENKRLEDVYYYDYYQIGVGASVRKTNTHVRDGLSVRCVQ